MFIILKQVNIIKHVFYFLKAHESWKTEKLNYTQNTKNQKAETTYLVYASW